MIDHCFCLNSLYKIPDIVPFSPTSNCSKIVQMFMSFCDSVLRISLQTVQTLLGSIACNLKQLKGFYILNYEGLPFEFYPYWWRFFPKRNSEQNIEKGWQSLLSWFLNITNQYKIKRENVTSNQWIHQFFP
jgi:hypothetical protein